MGLWAGFSVRHPEAYCNGDFRQPGFSICGCRGVHEIQEAKTAGNQDAGPTARVKALSALGSPDLTFLPWFGRWHPAELSVAMAIFLISTVQYGGPWPHVAIQSLTCG